MHSTKVSGHRPRKRFGQHFLHDQTVIHHILSAIAPTVDDHMIEIGPGLGALTRPLMGKLKNLTAIEIDRDLYTALLSLSKPQLTVIQADALKVDYATLGNNLRVVGNLPYNISTPLIFHLLHFAASIVDMHFMLQKEVVARLAAKPGSKAFGRLSVMVQYHCEVEHLFDVPPTAFDPPPKVESAVIRLIPYQQRPYPEVDQTLFETLIARAFSMRRKTLANNLKSLLSIQAIETLGIDPKLRPEQLTVLDYVKLTQFLEKN